MLSAAQSASPAHPLVQASPTGSQVGASLGQSLATRHSTQALVAGLQRPPLQFASVAHSTHAPDALSQSSGAMHFIVPVQAFVHSWLGLQAPPVQSFAVTQPTHVPAAVSQTRPNAAQCALVVQPRHVPLATSHRGVGPPHAVSLVQERGPTSAFASEPPLVSAASESAADESLDVAESPAAASLMSLASVVPPQPLPKRMPSKRKVARRNMVITSNV